MKAADLQMRANLNPLQPGKVNPGGQGTKTPAAGQPGQVNFGDVLNQNLEKTDTVKFSAHAVKRLEERSVHIGANEMERINNGVKQLDAKGGKNSLVMLNDTAFVVSVRNRVVITAVDKSSAQNNVFTNIDSVAFV